MTLVLVKEFRSDFEPVVIEGGKSKKEKKNIVESEFTFLNAKLDEVSFGSLVSVCTRYQPSQKKHTRLQVPVCQV